MNEKDHEEEDQIGELVNALHDPMIIPDSKSSFEKVKKRLEHERRKRHLLKRLKLIAAAILLLVIGATVFGNMSVTKAFTPIYHIIQNVKDDVIDIFIGTVEEDQGNAKTAPPPDRLAGETDHSQVIEHSAGISRSEQVTLEEAKEKMLFDFYMPDDIPSGFTLSRIELYYETGKDRAHMISLWYEGPDDQAFGILQEMMASNTALSSGINKSSGTIEEIQVQDHPAILITYTDGRLNVKTVMNRLLINVSGNVTEEEMMEITDSLQQTVD